MSIRRQNFLKKIEKLSEEAIEARREYQRAWNKRNPEKRRLYTLNYWTKIAQKATERGGGNDGQTNV